MDRLCLGRRASVLEGLACRIAEKLSQRASSVSAEERFYRLDQEAIHIKMIF
jgi:hypothetical protein